MRPKHDITKEIMLTNVVVAVFLKLDYLKKKIQTDPHTHTHTHTHTHDDVIQEGQQFRSGICKLVFKLFPQNQLFL